MNIYKFTDYKKMIHEWVSLQPKAGRGIHRRMSIFLGVSTTLISQIFNGDKDLSVEMADQLSGFIGLNNDESDYFLLLVEYKRAGTESLRKRWLTKIKERQEQASQIKNRVKVDVALSEVTKSIFYSQWLYSAVRNLSSIESYQNVEKMSEHLKIPREQILKIVHFLVQNNLCVQDNQKIKVGPAKTHEAADSPWALKHHQNWRLCGFNKMNEGDDKNLFYTGTMTMSEETAKEIREELTHFIQKTLEKVYPSPSKTTKCLNIDWFGF